MLRLSCYIVSLLAIAVAIAVKAPELESTQRLALVVMLFAQAKVTERAFIAYLDEKDGQK